MFFNFGLHFEYFYLFLLTVFLSPCWFIPTYPVFYFFTDRVVVVVVVVVVLQRNCDGRTK